jgi:hypothetical protein
MQDTQVYWREQKKISDDILLRVAYRLERARNVYSAWVSCVATMPTNRFRNLSLATNESRSGLPEKEAFIKRRRAELEAREPGAQP